MRTAKSDLARHLRLGYVSRKVPRVLTNHRMVVGEHETMGAHDMASIGAKLGKQNSSKYPFCDGY